MQPNVRPIHEVLKDVERDASDADWNGETDLARKLETVAHRLRERIADGEEWEPLF